MAVEYEVMRPEVNALATFRRSTNTGGVTTGYHQKIYAPDPTTDIAINVLVCPFDVTRRIAYLDAMNSSMDVRLWWLATETPIQVNPGDVFLIVEHGITAHYIVQMVDPDEYVQDTTVCICKKE